MTTTGERSGHPGRWRALAISQAAVYGLAASVAGFVITALLLRDAPAGGAAAWTVVAPLALAGVGGGMVGGLGGPVSHELTSHRRPRSLRERRRRGGALQTAQRIGAAIGTAVLATVFYHQLGQAGHAYRPAVSDALLCTAAVILIALLLAVTDVARHRPAKPPSASFTG